MSSHEGFPGKVATWTSCPVSGAKAPFGGEVFRGLKPPAPSVKGKDKGVDDECVEDTDVDGKGADKEGDGDEEVGVVWVETVKPPYQQAATLSGWPSRRLASATTP